MTEIEAFLVKSQRFDCEKLRAVLTVSQCAANRQRVPEIYACIGCAGLGKAIELEERMSEIKCKCGANVFAKGECRPCYDKRKHAERKAKRAAGVPVQSRQRKVVAEVNAAVQEHVERKPVKLQLLPVVLTPVDRFDLPDYLISRMKELDICPADLVDVLDAFLHGELERHPYRRAA